MSHPLHGRWREHWGGGHVTELDYTDEYDIVGDPAIIEAIARPAYRLDDVRVGDDRVSFTLVNQLDPTDPFVIRYELVAAEPGTLVGRASTNRGVDAAIRWTRH